MYRDMSSQTSSDTDSAYTETTPLLIDSVASADDDVSSVDSTTPLLGGGTTPFDLRLEGGGHMKARAAPNEDEFEIDVFAK